MPDLLQKSPGAMVDKDDNPTVVGKNGVQVFVDGRPNRLHREESVGLVEKPFNHLLIEGFIEITNQPFCQI